MKPEFTHSESVLQSLMKQVERAVRPVRAGPFRKLAMREELLAHLAEIYEQEHQRTADENAALAATLARFGDPGEITRGLDAAVGWNERTDYYFEILGRRCGFWYDARRGEPYWRFALRSLALLAALHAGLVLVLAALIEWGGISDHDPARWHLLWRVFPHQTLAMWGLFLAVPLLRQFMFAPADRGRWLQVASLLAAAGAWQVLITVCLWGPVIDDWHVALPVLGRIAVGSFVVLPVVLLIVTWIAERHQAPFRPWQQLRLEE